MLMLGIEDFGVVPQVSYLDLLEKHGSPGNLGPTSFLGYLLSTMRAIQDPTLGTVGFLRSCLAW